MLSDPDDGVAVGIAEVGRRPVGESTVFVAVKPFRDGDSVVDVDPQVSLKYSTA